MVTQNSASFLGKLKRVTGPLQLGSNLSLATYCVTLSKLFNLSLSFFICKMGIIVVSAFCITERIKCDCPSKALSMMPSQTQLLHHSDSQTAKASFLQQYTTLPSVYFLLYDSSSRLKVNLKVNEIEKLEFVSNQIKLMFQGRRCYHLGPHGSSCLFYSPPAKSAPDRGRHCVHGQLHK